MAISLSYLEKVLSFAVPIAAGILLIRLWHERLLHRYKFVSLSLLCEIADLGLLAVPRSKIVYLYVYAAYETVFSLVLIGLVIELFSLVVRNYPGIARSGRSFIRFAFALAILGSLLFALVYPQTGPGHFAILEHFFLVFRVTAFALMAFLVLVMAFVLWFPIPLTRNVLSLATGYSCYLICRALTRFAANLFGPNKYILLGTISMGVLFTSIVFWITSLTRRGENVNVVVGHSWERGRTQGLVSQLEAINASLLGTERPKSRP